MADYKKVGRHEIATYLDVTPKETTNDYRIIGVGVSEYTENYNPQSTTEKWIINKNATTTVDSYQVQGSVTQTCYVGDPVYDYVNELRRNEAVGSDAESSVIDVDLYDSETSTDGAITYKATKHACSVSVGSYGGSDPAQLAYNINYNGDVIKGKATISDGKLTFIESAD